MTPSWAESGCYALSPLFVGPAFVKIEGQPGRIVADRDSMKATQKAQDAAWCLVLALLLAILMTI